MLSRLNPRGPLGGPLFETRSKSPLPSIGKEPTYQNTSVSYGYISVTFIINKENDNMTNKSKINYKYKNERLKV